MRDQPIDDEASLRFRLATSSVGTKVPVKVLRAGKELTLDVPLSAPPEVPARDKSVLEGRMPLAGATVMNMSPAVAEELGLVEYKNGVVFAAIQPGSYAARFIRPGDMLTAVNNQPVKNVAELKASIAGGIQSVSISRDGLVNTIQFR